MQFVKLTKMYTDCFGQAEFETIRTVYRCAYHLRIVNYKTVEMKAAACLINWNSNMRAIKANAPTTDDTTIVIVLSVQTSSSSSSSTTTASATVTKCYTKSCCKIILYNRHKTYIVINQHLKMRVLCTLLRKKQQSFVSTGIRLEQTLKSCETLSLRHLRWKDYLNKLAKKTSSFIWWV